MIAPLPIADPVFYDISVSLRAGMVTWPGDPGIQIHKVLDLSAGDPATVSCLSMGAHTGTHVDAFSHFLPGGASLSEMDLSMYTGPARVVSIENPQCITPEELIALESRENFQWNTVKRVLFKTNNSCQPWYQMPFNPNFVYLTPEGAAFLAQQGVRLVGIDYLSVESFHAQNAPTHRLLMSQGIYIVEGLLLTKVPPGAYELLCLPLSLEGADGAPARAILRTLK